ncbi:hypothetical protein [Modicisalibacter luteus]|uniref:Uncharacterized protein n=1 Tax=Modicisalibacter luteus TaxID=453962 RepID=A0ABV7M6Z6_9GAMM|nr:hypothetical protein [Halomonas lutea]GHB13328.1 hypothetical protein GCM10007159_39540 [Halomonas lutea]
MKKCTPELSLQEDRPYWPDENEPLSSGRPYADGIEPCACLLSETNILGTLARDFQAVFGSA